MLDDIVVVTMAIDFAGCGFTPTDLETAGVKEDGRGAAIAGTAAKAVRHLTEAERLATRGFRENIEYLLAGACVLALGPSNPVVGLVAIPEFLAERYSLGTGKAAEGSDA
ncbi:hypothetical protein JX266_012513 [Neoarthrinium moseri]|uniref:uncharacterized protein n=1 Tax=Neoarthrinium moseri TaxID=1658444 RepID=UPI001FDB1359|nr:uncharacterized protein JN550_012307 [Neoarthrinium moseri]KAI1841277.1 hypothetical protein JX266_012513 [Neoarthrinium moseri]KAI1858949.1 hypothetical protein JN550_012307 [Neoarthrinium moseri]